MFILPKYSIRYCIYKNDLWKHYTGNRSHYRYETFHKISELRPI